ncbi:hypothetical protein PybrP1_002509 [[Pythium] brassicae (nom. inval.)]|nr:hypothetical protein PybrP1_002509 [[Pythium] brassicae (nom. inval.)]
MKTQRGGSGGAAPPKLRSNSSRSLCASSLDVVLERNSGSFRTIDGRASPAASFVSTCSPTRRGAPTVCVRIQRTQLVLLTLAVVGMIAALMWLCAGAGVRLETFVSTDKDEPARKQLLDKYNSISGNVVSVIVKPLEFLAAAVLALVLLCLATDFALSAHTTRFHHTLLALAAATGYLLTNGFNAMNVQLAPLPIRAVISAQDLSLGATTEATSITGYSEPEQKRADLEATVLNRALREETPENPLTNTIFRNSMLPPEFYPQPQCFTTRLSRWVDFVGWGGASALYRFPGQSWHAEALPKALTPAKSLKFVAENPSLRARVVSSRGVDASKSELPMPPNLAMRLLVDAIYNVERLFLAEWGDYNSAVQPRLADIIKRHITPGSYPTPNQSGPDDFPLLADLLFKDIARDARGQVSSTDALQVMANMTLATFSPKSVRGPNVEVELTHFDLSDELVFDAITVDFLSQSAFLQRRLMVNKTAELGFSELPLEDEPSAGELGGDRYYELDTGNECSLSACVLPNKNVAMRPHITAFRGCGGELGDSLRVEFSYPSANATVEPSISCRRPSESSFIVVSVGARIEGEEIVHGNITNSTREIIRLKNARKVYSLTVGRLSWKAQDLAAVYGAECASDDKSLCRGVRYKLSSSKGPKRKHVLVSSKRAPVYALQDYSYSNNNQEYVKLVELTAPTKTVLKADQDLVLPRRFSKSSLPRASDANSTACSAAVESLVYHTEMNHVYIEQSLQPAYTTALFFLFQEGVVREEVDDTNTTTATRTEAAEGSTSSNTTQSQASTLAFLRNEQRVDVRLSTPQLNVVLTLVGAAALLVLSAAIVATSGATETKLDRLADAHNVVEMLVDSAKYPSLLLEKTFSTSSPAASEESTKEDGDARSDDDDAAAIERGRNDAAAKQATNVPSATVVPLDERIRVQRAVLMLTTDADSAGSGSGAAAGTPQAPDAQNSGHVSV